MNAEPKVRKGDGRRARGNRTGFTTGACAAAAAKAAAIGLLTGEVPGSVLCRLPNGQTACFAVSEGRVEGRGSARTAHAVVVKDAGDDPDATHGAHLTADICLLSYRAGEIRLSGGAGVGTVTKEGLGLEVGGPAINPVPQRNIRDNVLAVAGAAREHPSVLIIGLALSIALMGIAANFIANLLNRHRWIAYVGLAIILYVALDMIYRGALEVMPYLPVG